MIAVGVAAILCRAGLEVRAQARLARCSRRFDQVLAYYQEGRIPILRMVDASRKLADAQLPLRWTRSGRIAVLAAHIERSERWLEFERAQSETYLDCRGVGRMEREEVESSIAECRERLARMVERSE